jgi:hypothetical protein
VPTSTHPYAAPSNFSLARRKESRSRDPRPARIRRNRGPLTSKLARDATPQTEKFNGDSGNGQAEGSRGVLHPARWGSPPLPRTGEVSALSTYHDFTASMWWVHSRHAGAPRGASARGYDSRHACARASPPALIPQGPAYGLGLMSPVWSRVETSTDRAQMRAAFQMNGSGRLVTRVARNREF